MGIIGLYVTFVLAVGKFIRLMFDKISTRVIIFFNFLKKFNINKIYNFL